MRRVLVTGASGCVGRHVLQPLVDRGWEVHAVSSREMPPGHPGVDWHRADLLDPDQPGDLLRSVRPSHLLHLAWYIAPGRWATAPENFAWVEASLRLLRGFQEQGGTRIVSAGSCLEYDWSYGYCAENRTPCNPHTAYGVSKHALQLLTSAYTAQTELTGAWGRIFFLYGPYEHPDRLVASVIRSLLAKQPARCSHGNQVRDYLFVQDVADAFVALVESTATGSVNIASGRPVTLKEIVTRIGALLGRSELIRFGAIPPASTDTPLVVADVTHLERTLDWRPRYDLESGLAHTIEWWRRQLDASPAAAVHV